jgi:hypothetical protein
MLPRTKIFTLSIFDLICVVHLRGAEMKFRLFLFSGALSRHFGSQTIDLIRKKCHRPLADHEYFLRPADLEPALSFCWRSDTLHVDRESDRSQRSLLALAVDGGENPHTRIKNSGAFICAVAPSPSCKHFIPALVATPQPHHFGVARTWYAWRSCPGH